MPSHGVRVQPSGQRRYYVVKRVRGALRWVKLGKTTELTIAESRKKAGKVLDRLEQGLAPVEPSPPKKDSVADVMANWLKRHVEARGVRTGREMARVIRKYVLPVWAEREFTAIKRSDVAVLLDQIEDRHGAHTADHVLMVLRTVANWVATRDDSYTPPFVKNMQRVPAYARKRSRALDDDELRQIWQAAGEVGVYGAFIRMALTTAQRREVLLHMKWDAIADGIWHIPVEMRAKGTGRDLKLPQLALEAITELPRFAGNSYIFAGRNGKPIGDMSGRKAQLDKLSGVNGWRVHDLRRTARSLMSRAGVLSEHAEKVLGHATGTIEAIYDVHAYIEEKGTARGTDRPHRSPAGRQRGSAARSVVKKTISIPAMRHIDRVEMAAREDALTRTDKNPRWHTKNVEKLLDRIAEGHVPALSRQEMKSLNDYHAGKFNLRPGYSPAREYFGFLTEHAVDLYRKKREQGATESENNLIEIVRAEMGYHQAPEARTMKNGLHRSRAWSAKRRQNKK